MTDKMMELIKKLNYYDDKYNEGNPEISDAEYDALYFELKRLEEESGISHLTSPTQNIRYKVMNGLEKVTHNHWMGSADKTKDWNEFLNYFSNIDTSKDVIGMLKLDGFTLSLEYINGCLVGAETRGDGTVGENVLHNALVINSIPKTIEYKEHLIVDGEVICKYDDFEEFSKEYANPRNFASGSIRLLDSEECKNRNLTFVAWYVVKGLSDKLIDNFNTLEKLGFTVTPWTSSFDWDAKEYLINQAKELNLPIDGLIGRFESREFGESLGKTSHHSKALYAFKMYDEEMESRLLKIDYEVSRTGVLTPVAVFEPIELEGTTVERASLHNLSIMRETLGVYPDLYQPVFVIKSNQIIPQIVRAGYKNDIPHDHIIFDAMNCRCPICGELAEIKTSDSGVKTLVCPNSSCEGKLAQQIAHFASRDKGLDIRGLSLKTIEKLVEWGWVNELEDIYELAVRSGEWKKKPGFGPKSVDNVLAAIEVSKTTILEQFISGIGIPLVGRRVSKQLAEYFKSWDNFRSSVIDGFDFTTLDGFGYEMDKAIHNFNYNNADKIAAMLTFTQPEVSVSGDKATAAGLTFVLTGKMSKPRSEIEADIVAAGGKVSGSVSAKTNYLVIDDVNSTTGKAKSARDKGVPMISENELYEIIG